MRLLISTLLVLLFTIPTHAATLQWDANTETDRVGYILQWRASLVDEYHEDDIQWVSKGEELDGLVKRAIPESLDGYIFSVICVDAAGNKSGRSDEVLYDTVPKPPSGFKLLLEQVVSWILSWFA